MQENTDSFKHLSRMEFFRSDNKDLEKCILQIYFGYFANYDKNLKEPLEFFEVVFD